MLLPGMPVNHAAGRSRATGLRTGLVLRALVDDLAVVHVQLVRVHGLPTGDGLHVEVLDPMEIGQCKGKSFSLFGRDKVIDVDSMNRLITRVIATTVAQWFPASREAGQEDISHHDHLCMSRMPAMTGIPVWTIRALAAEARGRQRPRAMQACNHRMPLTLCAGFLENLTQLPHHLLPLVRGVMLAHLGAGLIFAHLVDPIPEQLRPPPGMLGELLEVRLEKAKGGDGLALAAEQIAMH